MFVGIGIGVTASQAIGIPAPPPVPTEVTVLATRLFGPGHGQTSSAPASNGTTSTTALTLVNESGAPMDRVRLGFIGWAIQAVPSNPGAPLGIPGNAIPIDSATIEYPVGTVVGTFQRSGSGAFSIPSDTDLITTDELALASAIPAGASFRVSVASTVPNGQRRLHNNGLAAVLTTAMSNTLKKARVFATGDSIMTQDARGAVLLAGAGRCPVLQMSIGGTRGFDYVPVAARLAKLAKDVGCTDSITNFGTNDFGADQTEAQLASTLAALRSAYAAEGLDHWQATILPQSSMPTVTVVSAVVDSAAEPTLTITVSETDAARFETAMAYTVAGDTGSPSLNNTYWLTKASPTTWIGPVPADRAGRVGTGTITIKPAFNFSSTTWQQPRGNDWHAVPTLATSPRANINARIRAGEFGGLVEWADALESGRNTGKWRTREDQPDAYHLDNVQLQVIAGIANANRFSFSPNQPSNKAQGGGVVMLTGGTRGQYRNSTGNQSNDVSTSSNLPAVPAVGDQFMMISGSVSPTTDGVHPSLSGGGTGGAQNRLVDVNRAWLDTLLV